MNDTLFAVQNYKGCTVSCTNTRWDTHIVAGHEIMEKNVDAVKDTIKHPDSVYASSQNKNREVYFKKSTCSTYNALTKVIVDYAPGKKNPHRTVGSVVTAFPANKEKGGIGNAVYTAP